MSVDDVAANAAHVAVQIRAVLGSQQIHFAIFQDGNGVPEQNLTKHRKGLIRDAKPNISEHEKRGHCTVAIASHEA